MGAGGTNERRPLYFNFVLVLSIFSLCYCNITSQFSNYFHRGFYLSLGNLQLSKYLASRSKMQTNQSLELQLNVRVDFKNPGQHRPLHAAVIHFCPLLEFKSQCPPGDIGPASCSFYTILPIKPVNFFMSNLELGYLGTYLITFTLSLYI